MTETEMEKHRNARGGEGVVCESVCDRERVQESVFDRGKQEKTDTERH